MNAESLAVATATLVLSLGIAIPAHHNAESVAPTKPLSRQTESQQERDELVSAIEISPSNVILARGENVFLTAVPYSAGGRPIAGVTITWTAHDSATGRQVSISHSGKFGSAVPGTFEVRATAGNRQVTSLITVSTANRKSVAHRRRMAEGWTESNYLTAFDTRNWRGRQPTESLHAALFRNRQSLRGDGTRFDAASGASNFTFAVPLQDRIGRGIDISLELVYNSRLWHRVGESEIHFDIDRDWPAPGWSLGFGKLVSLDSRASRSMLIDSDGTRHRFGVLARGASAFRGHTTDGSHIRYSHEAEFLLGTARYPNGTTVTFGARGDEALYPVEILDANGNYITITYRNNTGPALEKVVDTLGRVIEFHYDANNALTAVTGPGLSEGPPTVARLHYRDVPTKPAFHPDLVPIVRPGSLASRKLDAIYFPATRTGYWFGDKPISTYGMITAVVEQRAMSIESRSLNDQGSISPGVSTRKRVFDYPTEPNPALQDAPTYSRMEDSWEGMDTTTPAVTRYVTHMPPPPEASRIEQIDPSGTRSVQFLYNRRRENRPDQLTYDHGLPYFRHTYDAAGRSLEIVRVEWLRKSGEAVPGLIELIDERNQKLRTQYLYNGPGERLSDVLEYGYGLHPIRKTRIEYETDPRYEGRIRDLVKSREVYEGNGVKPVHLIEYRYDGHALMNTPGVVHHRDTHNPYASVYDPATDFRGNLTSLTMYEDAATRSGAVTHQRRYDITGNVISIAPPCCEQTTLHYTPATQYAYPTSVTSGAVEASSQARMTAVFSYDFDSGLLQSTTDPGGKMVTYRIDPLSLRLQAVLQQNGTAVSYHYDDVALSVEEIVRRQEPTIAGHRVWRLNGLGLVQQEQTETELHEWDKVDRKYDALGRLWQYTQPYRGDKPPDRWTYIYRDGLGRAFGVISADLATNRTVAYNEVTRPTSASGDAGQTIRTTDAWGNERWARIDALGRVVEVVEPDPATGRVLDTDRDLVTTYYYDAMDRVTEIQQGAQWRGFIYDSLGRLIRQRVPEKSATLNEHGRYIGAGWFTDVFTYDQRSNLTSYTDARGVKTIYSYQDDPLNRLHSITYDTSGFGDTKNPIVQAPSVRYEYMPIGNLNRVWRVTTEGVSREQYTYDSDARLKSKSVTFLDRPDHPMEITYSYDGLDRLVGKEYPTQYGTSAAARPFVVFDHYETSGRLKALTVDGAVEASALTYGPGGDLTSLKVGPNGLGQVTETYDFDPLNGLLQGQQVQRLRISLLDRKYKYLGPETGDGATGRVTEIEDKVDGRKSRTYRYDALGRLSSASGGEPAAPIWNQEYFYDRYGNRVGLITAGKAADGSALPTTEFATVVYDATSNRVSDSRYRYDAAGNQVAAPVAENSLVSQLYEYDAAGRVVKVRHDSGAVLETYTYGSDRRRLISQRGGDFISQSMPEDRTLYVWDGAQVIAEYQEAGASSRSPRWVASFVYLGSRLLLTSSPTASGVAATYSHPDRLGTRLVTNAIDSSVGQNVTLPYGIALAGESSSGIRPEFTSYQRSAATGIDYAVNRNYSALQGRFMQPDPLGIASSDKLDPQTLNLYAYVHGDPINRRDPLGLADSDEECETVVHELPGAVSTICISVIPPPPPSLTGGRGLAPGVARNDTPRDRGERRGATGAAEVAADLINELDELIDMHEAIGRPMRIGILEDFAGGFATAYAWATAEDVSDHAVAVFDTLQTASGYIGKYLESIPMPEIKRRLKVKMWDEATQRYIKVKLERFTEATLSKHLAWQATKTWGARLSALSVAMNRANVLFQVLQPSELGVGTFPPGQRPIDQPGRGAH